MGAASHHSVRTPKGLASDADLVTAARSGSRPAFSELVDRYKNLVFSVAYTLSGSVAESDEVAHEAFLLAWKQLPALRDPQRFRSWICSITRNTHRRLRIERDRRF